MMQVLSPRARRRAQNQVQSGVFFYVEQFCVEDIAIHYTIRQELGQQRATRETLEAGAARSKAILLTRRLGSKNGRPPATSLSDHCLVLA